MFDSTAAHPEYRVHDAIATFVERAPDVDIDINVLPINEIEKGLLEGKYHIGFLPESKTEEIMAHTYVGLSFSSPNMEAGKALNLHKSATATDQKGIATLIQSGQYIGFLPEHFADIMVAEGEMQKIENPKFSYYCEFTAVYRKSPKPTRLVKEFLNALEQTKVI